MGSFFVAAAFAYTGSSIAYVSVHWIGQHFCAWEPTIKVQAESVAIKLGHPILDVMHKTCCLLPTKMHQYMRKLTIIPIGAEWRDQCRAAA